MLDRSARIESRLARVELFLANMGFDAPGPPPPPPPPVHQGAGLLRAFSQSLEEEEEEQQQQRQRQRHVEEGTRSHEERAMLEDEEVQRLIERCMGQL